MFFFSGVDGLGEVSLFYQVLYFKLILISAYSTVREVIKATILKQDPPNLKIDGGFCLHPLPPIPLPQPQKMVSLLHSYPTIQQ